LYKDKDVRNLPNFFLEKEDSTAEVGFRGFLPGQRGEHPQSKGATGISRNRRKQISGGLRIQSQFWFQSAGGKIFSAVPQLSKDHGITEQGKACWHPHKQKQIVSS